MHVSAMNLHYRWYPFQRFLDDVERLGLHHIELWGGSPHFNSDDISYREVRKFRKTFEERDLTLVCHTPEQCMYPINIASDYPAMRGRSIEYFKKNIDIASDLGAPLMLVTPGTGYVNEDTSLVWDRSRDALMELALYAQEADLRLGLEVLRGDESTIIHSVSALRQMVDEVDSSHLGGILDTIPMAINGETPKEYCNALKEKLFHIHFIDGTPYLHLAWGDGILDVQSYLVQLSDNGYTGALSLEITDHRYLANPEGALEKSLGVLFRYLKHE
jgi:protein FrlC